MSVANSIVLIFVALIARNSCLPISSPTNVTMNCGWFEGEGPDCLSHCPEGWSLILSQYKAVGENEICAEGGSGVERKFCCEDDDYDYDNYNNSSPAGSETDSGDSFPESTRFGKATLIKKYTLTQLLAQKDEGSVLKEAKIILPKLDNDGRSLEKVRLQLVTRIIKNFGGLTQLDGQGDWMDDTGKLFEEAVWVYVIAVVVKNENYKKLDNIANWLKTAAEQESIYLRYPDGRVTFV